MARQRQGVARRWPTTRPQVHRGGAGVRRGAGVHRSAGVHGRRRAQQGPYCPPAARPASHAGAHRPPHSWQQPRLRGASRWADKPSCTRTNNTTAVPVRPPAKSLAALVGCTLGKDFFLNALEAHLRKLNQLTKCAKRPTKSTFPWSTRAFLLEPCSAPRPRLSPQVGALGLPLRRLTMCNWAAPLKP